MKRLIFIFLVAVISVSTLVAAENQNKPGKNYRLRNEDLEWLTSPEARGIAEQVMAYQRVTGGWPKNIDMCRQHSSEELAAVRAENVRTDDSTTDNDATTTQMKFLARMYAANSNGIYRDSFKRGLEYLLSGQYEDSGGWPQFWPHPEGYQVHITFNDDAMACTLELMRQILNGEGAFGGDLVDEEMKHRVKTAFDKGIACILATQIRVDGKPTVWCQQHDRFTLAPASARTYELPSFCTQESASLVRLLMSLPEPDKKVRDAVNGAMEWFDDHKLMGYRLEHTGTRGQPGFDTRLVADPDAGPLWGRFYDLDNCEVFVCDRDGIPRKSLQEIGSERRNGYSWYNTRPAELYPIYEEWKAANK